MKINRSGLITILIFLAAVILITLRLKNNRAEYLNEVDVARRKVEKIAVTIDTVSSGIISANVTATGVLEPSEALTVVSETQGKIIKIFREKGDIVSAGDVILKVDDEVISANVLTAEANYAQFEKDIDRLTRLSEENAVTKRDLEQASIGMKKAKADLITANKALSNTSIKAPVSGYINTDFVTTGQFLGGGSPVCEIVNNASLKLNIKVTEHEVYKIRKGQEVTINLTAFPGMKFTGYINSIAEKADMAMKFNVEISLPNKGEIKLKSGLYAEAVLPVRNDENLIINKNAIVGSMEKPIVFIVKEGKAVRKEITTGQSNDTRTEVLGGLSKGDLLIVGGQLNLKDGDEIRITE
ncbi:MAG TPA: efflux RND transporter periplasmic adaptor subunit [Bacteroidales bacterium]|nr:efflux RND transporter periplasmic adaptor subunit [Bacteroidales bacterium]